jgi:hypothetical protein
MTRKDYIATANILNAVLTDAPELVMNIAKEFGIMFKRDNSAFDMTRFLDAVQKEW